MRRTVLLLGAVLAVSASAAEPPARAPSSAPEKGKPPLSVGENLPGPFHPYNVNGPNKRRFHCLVSQYGQEPVVMIFHRGLEVTEGFRDLLKALDNAVEKNPAVRLHCFVVFVSEDVNSVVEEDDKREELEKKVEGLVSEMKLKHVVFTLDDRADVEKYGLSDKADVTVVLYERLKVLAVDVLAADKLNAARVKEVLARVADKLGARRK